MAKTKRKSLHQVIEDEAIKKLTVQPYSVSQLADMMNHNYYTVRKAVKHLEDIGIVTSRPSNGNVLLYSLSEPDKAPKNNSIPTVRRPNGNVKLTAMLELVGQEDKSLTYEAVMSLPRNVTRLFMSALRHADTNGKYDINKNLKNIRLELETHRMQLASTLAIYDAILQADVLWDANKIKAMPYDRTFDRDKVIEAYRHYYPED